MSSKEAQAEVQILQARIELMEHQQKQALKHFAAMEKATTVAFESIDYCMFRSMREKQMLKSSILQKYFDVSNVILGEYSPWFVRWQRLKRLLHSFLRNLT
jgi:hypothetical protein